MRRKTVGHREVACSVVTCVALLGLGCQPLSAGRERRDCLRDRTCQRGLTCLSDTCVRAPACDCATPPPAPPRDTVQLPPLHATPSARDPVAPARTTEIELRSLSTPWHTPPAPEHRWTVFRLWPNHVAVDIDGVTVDVTHPVELAVGPHRIEILASCCEPFAGTFTVADSAQHTPQLVVLALTLRPAEVRLAGAPADGVMSCNNGLVLRGSSEVGWPMQNVSEAITCRFLRGREFRVEIRAGSRTVVTWWRDEWTAPHSR